MSKKSLLNYFCTVATLGIAVSSLPQLAAKAVSVNFVSNLSGVQEVPPVTTPAIGSATGTLTGDFGSNNFVFTYAIAYAGFSSPILPVGPPDNPTGGHIHNAPVAANGPIVHVLDTFPFDYNGTTLGGITGNWRFDDQVRPLTEVLAQELLDGNMYINLHTVNFPSGEIRGQVVPAVPEPFTILGSATVLGFGVLFKKEYSRRLKKIKTEA